jgi:two-component system, OmpR family, sensor histidine kinase KdpD
VIGILVGIALAVGAGAAMLPFRPHLSIATAGLVLVLPILAGAVVGGIRAGIASVAAGFLVFDVLFVPPYGRLSVQRQQDLVALAVYAVVMVLVAALLSRLDAAREEARAKADEARRIVDLSDLLVEDRSTDELLRSVVRAVATLFDVPAVALLVPDGEVLRIAASTGETLTAKELRSLEPRSGVPVGLAVASASPDELQTVALIAGGEPVGLLALRTMPDSEEDRALLRSLVNHAALALERSRLRDQALRSELLEEVDRLRHAMVGAVSHDLRTPLATMKVASSTLVEPRMPLSDEDEHELHLLIDHEVDRLIRLVTSLLDVTRIDAGVLEVHRGARSVPELVREAVATLQPSLGERGVETEFPEPLPDVDVDPLLIGQVLANLLDNANRHAPPDTVITVAGKVRGDHVAVSVTDEGPGIPQEERETVFDRFVRFDTGGRAGLGLAIAKTFVEAHGEMIWVEEAEGEGSRFVFTLPTAASNGAGRKAAGRNGAGLNRLGPDGVGVPHG